MYIKIVEFCIFNKKQHLLNIICAKVNQDYIQINLEEI